MHTLGQNHLLPWLVTFPRLADWLKIEIPSLTGDSRLPDCSGFLNWYESAWDWYERVETTLFQSRASYPTIYTEGKRSQDTLPPTIPNSSNMPATPTQLEVFDTQLKNKFVGMSSTFIRRMLSLQRLLSRLSAVKSYLYQMISLLPKTIWSSHTWVTPSTCVRPLAHR